jgi:putative PIN family toxin of toxin-antitoxin system
VRATIDASAWVSVVLSRLGRAEPIADALRSGRVTLVTSEPVFAETAEVLERPRLVRTGEARLLARSLLAMIRELAEFVTIAGNLQLCRDPNDDVVIETALLGGAELLVTEDKDLIEDPNVRTTLETAGIRVLRVAQFLAEIAAPDEE